VADTFDALTTNRPYQQAHETEEALRIIQSLAGQRLDPKAVAALLAVYGRGEIRIVKQMTLTIPLEPNLPVTVPAEHGDPVTVETTRS
jgi:HD-GYP domain-containing protein (c-di-GMP phosphodiesterase class II)